MCTMRRKARIFLPNQGSTSSSLGTRCTEHPGARDHGGPSRRPNGGRMGRLTARARRRRRSEAPILLNRRGIHGPSTSTVGSAHWASQVLPPPALLPSAGRPPNPPSRPAPDPPNPSPSKPDAALLARHRLATPIGNVRCPVSRTPPSPSGPRSRPRCSGIMRDHARHNPPRTAPPPLPDPHALHSTAKTENLPLKTCRHARASGHPISEFENATLPAHLRCYVKVDLRMSGPPLNASLNGAHRGAGHRAPVLGASLGAARREDNGRRDLKMPTDCDVTGYYPHPALKRH